MCDAFRARIEAPGSMTTHLLYLHGLKSSPQSAKARQVGDWAKEHAPQLTWWCPQLPASPREAMDKLLRGTVDWPKDRMGIVGSSLGAFYATVLAERFDCPAVLLNPSVDPARDLARHVGESTHWHSGEPFVFLPSYLDELRDMTPQALEHLDRYLAIIATGDEVLDWRDMAARYRGAHLRIVEGSDHALSDFDDHLPLLLDFLQLFPSS
jgi:predicted esterase YcpF (UPF0227 family)